MLRMDAIFLCFILQPSKKAPISALQRFGRRSEAASIGDGWDGEDALPWANRGPAYVILQTTKLSLYNVSRSDPCVASNAWRRAPGALSDTRMRSLSNFQGLVGD